MKNRVSVPENVARLMSEEDRKALGVETQSEWLGRISGRDEKKLQHRCELILTHYRFFRLSSDNAAREYVNRGKANELLRCQGWYGHLSQAKRNAFMPDLFLFSPDMDRCEMIELKAPGTPRFQPGQKEMTEMRIWTLIQNEEAFIALVRKLIDDWRVQE